MKNRKRKRIVAASLLAIFFLAGTAKAIVPLVAAIPVAKVGVGIAVIAAAGIVTKINLDKVNIPAYHFDSDQLQRDIVATTAVMVDGKEALIGYSAAAAYNFKQAWNDGAFALVPEVQTVARSTFPSGVNGDLSGTNVPCGPTQGNCSTASGQVNGIVRTNHDLIGAYTNNQAGKDAATAAMNSLNGTYQQLSATLWKYRTAYGLQLTLQGLWGFWFDTYTATPIAGIPTPPPDEGIPPFLSDAQASQLAANVAAAAADDARIAAALDAAAVANPPYIATPPALAIPPSAVASYAAAAAASARAAEIAALEAAAAANPGDIAAAARLAAAVAADEIAKAKQIADAATSASQAADDIANTEPEVEPETFAPVAAAAFATAYNPGAFDIPARFTTFVNTVKSSPLFSFSTGFFNSLPGGGSPIYEIDAGQYGHHTIDLSQTMSGGLAVMKTVLLMVFGFFSIRSVIMKR